MKKFVLFLPVLLLFRVCVCSGQTYSDTLKVMYYNILSYDYSSDCTAMKTIFRYSQPDVIALTEVPNNSAARHMIDFAINTDNNFHFDTTAYFSINPANKGNMLFYNKSKLSFKFQDTIHPAGERFIDRYRLYYNEVIPDTIFMDFYIAHLTPNQGGGSEQARWNEVKASKIYMDTHNACDNIFYGGDLNLYSGFEDSYKLLVDSGSCRLNDPIDTGGYWHDNSLYATIHTQSTRINLGGHGGGASGGMDDRFDFIFLSNDIMSGSNKITFIPGSYHALGNDGNHFNTALSALPLSGTVPDSVTNALMWKSDHLPVVLDVEIPRRYTVSVAENIIQDINCYVDYSSGRIYFGDGAFLLSEITILNLLGQAVMRNQLVQSNSLDIRPLENGIYLFRITDKTSIKTGKFIILK